MAGCSGITGAGARCRAIAISGSDYCHAHHPDRAEARRRSARKGGQRGGRGRPQADLATLKEKLINLGEDVLEGRVGRANAAVAGQLWNIAIAAIRTGLKAKEVEELEIRIEELEAVLDRKRQQESA